MKHIISFIIILLAVFFEAKSQSNVVYQSPIDPNTRQIDTNLPVGTIAGGASVSANGAATYSIPIFVSPGTEGIQPNISIVYNSMADYGLLGMGWNISGLSAIIRTGNNKYNDGTCSPVKLNTSDKLSLDGNRLIAITGSYGGNGTEYRTENETFVKVISLGSVNGFPDRFIVYTKEGLEIEYGNTVDSKIEAQGKTDVIIWYINKVKDRNGNYMTFVYTENNTTGESRIDRINYTGNEQVGYQPYNSLRFYYETRLDKETSYIAGTKFQSSVLLRNIKAYNNNTVVKTYEFLYSFNIHSKLSEIKELGADMTPLNTTAICWGPTVNAITDNPSSSISIPGDKYYGDFNGDGRTDLVFFTSPKGNNDMTYYLANADGRTFTNGGTITGTTTLLGEPKGIIVTDFDGDGLSDIILKYKWVGDESIDPKSTGFKFYRSTGNAFSLVNSVWAGNNASEEFAGDFDNDGKKELFYRAIDWEGFYNYYLLRPNSLPIVLRNEVPGDEDIVVADFTGEGQSDVLILNSTGYSINEVIGNNLVLKSSGSQFASGSGIISFGDFNGDGKADILKSGPVPYFYLSNGNIFENVNPWDDILRINLIKPVVKDFNGDGKDDILDITSSTEATLYHNSGSYISAISLLNTTVSLSGSADSYNDFNGDGLPDYYNESRMICFNENDNRFKVTTILDGFNRKTSFNYKSIVDPTVYTKGSGAIYPVSDFQSPLKVVESVVSESGYGQFVTTRYTYQGAKRHLLGRGFLGFSGLTSFNTTSNIKVVSNNYLNSSYYLMLPESSRAYSSNTLVSEQIDTMDIKDYGNKRIFVYRKSSTNRKYDLYTQVLYATSYERYSYDDYGNPVLIESNTGGIVFGKTENTWINSGGYCLNRILSSKKTITRSGESPYVSVTDYSHYNGNLFKTTHEPGNEQKIITDYQYGSAGKVYKVTVSNNGTNGRSETLNYDTYRRFLTKRTNEAGHFTQTTYDFGLGVPLEVKDHNNITTSYTYDGFGRLTQTTAPDGNISKVTLYWVTGSGPQYALYYSKTETPGNPPVYVYYDKLGREIRSQKTSLDGTQVYSDIHYDAKGQVDQVTLPYFSGASNFNYKEMEYDNLGRITSETAPGVNTTYSYNGLSATITDHIAVQTYTRTADATGSLVSATDQGGTIGYSYYSSGLVKAISAPGKTITMAYDQFGRQTQLADPDAGTYRYGYNVYGELIWQTDPQERTTYLDYNDIGQLTSQTGGTFNINYTYRPNGWLDNVSSSNNVNYTLEYDGLGRVTGKTEYINGAEIITGYGYNPIGQLNQVSYANSGLSVNYNYQNGYLKELKRGDNNALIWTLNSVNEKDQLTQASFGNGLVTTRGYHTIGYLTSINTGNGSIQNLEYQYNTKGLMDWRRDNRRGLTESFGYDPLNRLNLIQVNGVTTQNIQYSAAGNIQSKTGVGNFTYGGSQPNALTQISNPQMLVSPDAQNVTYTTFDKVSQITEAANSASITYGPDYQRKMMTTLINGVSSTKYYSDAYEREIKNGVTRELHYVVAYNDIVAIFEKKSTDTNPVMHYVHTDHLGSLNVITSESGTIEQEMSFDAWGNRRDPNTWQNLTSAPTNLITDRGFTGHEHMDGFKLINMNGRVYDPLLGRFLSADPFVQSPEFTQSYNRYSYVVNNPLSFTDPSGYYVFEPQTFWQEQINTTAERGGLLPSGNFGGGGPGGSYTSIIDWDVTPVITTESYLVKVLSGEKYYYHVQHNISTSYIYKPVYGYTPSPISGYVSGDYGGGRPSIGDAKARLESAFKCLPDKGEQVLPPVSGFWGYTSAILFGRSYTDNLGMTWDVGFDGKTRNYKAITGMAPSIGGPSAGKALYTVYQGIKNGKIVYWGITKNFDLRVIQHAGKHGTLFKIYENVSRNAARGLEQLGIDKAGLKNLENIINSISTKNPRLMEYYREAIRHLQNL